MAWLKGCDFSFNKPNLTQLWADGFRVILVYLSTTSSKGVTASYAKQALDLGFKILPLYETTSGAALGGYSTGLSHAKTATSIAKSLGIPPEVPIIYALDENYSASQLSGPVSEYVRGLHAVSGPDALYGGYNQLNYFIKSGNAESQNFQTYAWSSGRWLPTSSAPIEQYKNGVNVAGGTVDLCRVQDNLIFWEKNMALTNADAVTVFSADVVPNPAQRWDSPKHVPPIAKPNPTTSVHYALGDIWQLLYNLRDAVSALKSDVAALKTSVDALKVAQTPPPANVSVDQATLEAALAQVLATLKIEVVPNG